MLERTWDVVSAVWLHMLLATGLVLVAAGIGWRFGQNRSLWAVRLISWWLARVIVPLLKSRSWASRAVTILVNNLSVLCVLVVAGTWFSVGLVAVAGLGLSLGIALKCLGREADELIVSLPAPDEAAKRHVRIGVALNLLEPPAIVVALGLCLGRRPLQLSAEAVWEAFAVWVLPAMLLAACGEALWLGVGRKTKRLEDHGADDAPPPSPDS